MEKEVVLADAMLVLLHRIASQRMNYKWKKKLVVVVVVGASIHCILHFMHTSQSIIYAVEIVFLLFRHAVLANEKVRSESEWVEKKNGSIHYSFSVYISFVSSIEMLSFVKEWNGMCLFNGLLPCLVEKDDAVPVLCLYGFVQSFPYCHCISSQIFKETGHKHNGIKPSKTEQKVSTLVCSLSSERERESYTGWCWIKSLLFRSHA